MTGRVFSGGALVGLENLASGVLEVTPVPETTTAGGQVVSTGTFTYTIAAGLITGPLTSGQVRIPSPLNARFVVRSDASPRVKILDFVGSVEESNDPITLGEIYRDATSPIDISPSVVHAGDDITRLHGTGTTGQVPVLQGDGTFELQDQTGGGSGDVTGGALSAVGEIAVYGDTTGKALTRSNKTIAQLTADIVATIVAGAPATLDTLLELAAALNDNPAQIDDILTSLGLKATAADLTAEINARIAADVAIDTRLDALESAAVEIDLDDMPPEYAGAATDAARLQWAVGRLLLTNAGVATERNIVVLVGEREYDVTAAAFQETSSPNGGVTAGANAQILLPAVGPIATKKVLTLTFRAKKPSSFGYSVVNGDPSNVLPTNAVIRSDAVGLGDKAMIGASQAVDGYAGLYLSNIIVVFEGVTFRAGGGITAFDARYCFSVQGSHFIADTGVVSDELHNHDPRRLATPEGDPFDFTIHDDADEIAYAKRSHGLKTPRLWNGGHCNVANINVQGFRYGVDWNEHCVSTFIFNNYCYASVKLRGMSHTALIVEHKHQRCPIGLEAPEANDWGGSEDTALITVLQQGSEAYHPGEFGNPAGDRWYNHRVRIWDPSDLILGDITVYASPVEQPPTYPTLTTGHGGNINLRLLGEASGGGSDTTDTTPALQTLTPVAGTVTVVGNSATDIEAIQEVATDANLLVAFPALAHGTRGTLIIKHSGAGNTVGLAAAPSGYTIIDTGSIAAGVDDRADVVEYKCVWTSNPERKIIRVTLLEGEVVTGLTTEGGGGGAIMEDTFTASDGTALHGRTPSPTAGPATWVSNIFGAMDIQGNAARATTEVAAIATYDVGAADVLLTVVTNQPAAASAAFPEIEFNRSDASNYWYLTWRQSDGFTAVGKVVAGSASNVNTTTLTIANDTDVTWSIEADGDDIIIKKDGSTVTALTVNESGRFNKTADIIAIKNGNSGFVLFKSVLVEAAP